MTSEYQAQRDSYINKGTQGWGYYQENGNKGNGGPATDSCVISHTQRSIVFVFIFVVLSDCVSVALATPGMESLSQTLAPLLLWTWMWIADACVSI